MFTMNWKSTILCFVILQLHALTLTHSIRIPPRFSRTSTKVIEQNATSPTSDPIENSKINATKLEELLSKVAKTSLAEQESPETVLLQNAQISTVVPFLNRRTYTNTHNTHKSLPKQEQTSALKPSAKNIGSTKYNSNTDDYDTLHMGVAVPLTAEDIEREISNGVPAATNVQSKPIETSTAKPHSLSTWIFDLNEQNERRATPTPTAMHKEGKIEKIQKPRGSTTVKPKFKPSSGSAGVKPSQKASQKPTQKQSQKPANNKVTISKPTVEEETLKKINKNNHEKNEPTAKPTKSTTPKSLVESMAKKIVKKASATMASGVTKTQTTKPKTTTTTTTEAPEPITELVETTQEPPYEVSSTTVESTTFLIMEPKDADFDIPADRSPGSTKKPKKSKTKKNKNKSELSKKPSKPVSSSNKEKPLSTKIYNYLAREVMPTVGMGLVGLTVAAGLATYFLAPFGALRRSYEITDRKDELPPFANDEYAPKEGATEEENYNQMVAPNSPYRNSVRYTLRQTGPNMGPRPMGKFVQGPPPQYRVRNVAPQNYPAIAQPQYHNYQQNPLQRRDQYPQQYYRYTNDPQDVNIYRQSTYLQAYQEQQQEKEKLLQQQLLQQQQKQQQQQQQLIQQPDSSVPIQPDQLSINQAEIKMDQSLSVSHDESMDTSYFPDSESSHQYYENHQPNYSDMQPSTFGEGNLQPGLVFSENPYKDMTSTSMQINSDDSAQSEPEKSLQTESNNLPMIVTPEPNIGNNIMITNDNLPEDNILRRRSQFIVGQSIQTSTDENPETNSKPVTVDAVPEHGPRRRRDVPQYQQDMRENEIDQEYNGSHPGMNTFNSGHSNMMATTPKYPPIRTTIQPFRPLTTLMNSNSNNSFANMFNGFLRGATRAVQTTISEITAVIPKYLKAFERLINEIRIISNHAINNNTSSQTVNLDKNPQSKSALAAPTSSSSSSSSTGKTQTNQH